jgi:FMN phosphatase YigB (HAD superfamily)
MQSIFSRVRRAGLARGGPAGTGWPTALTALATAIARADLDVMISTDLFDTVLLRDHTIESARLATAARRAAGRLGVDAAALTRLRWSLQGQAYQAVAMERPEGEASLAAICRTAAAALGLRAEAALLLRRTELEVDAEHLRPNRPLLTVLERAASTGRRVIAVSDTHYSADDLRWLLDTVVGPHSFAAVHSSADLGLTKHAGGIFAEVARLENVEAGRILHVGDGVGPDVRMAEAAGWTAVHLPRDRRHRAGKLAGKAIALPTKLRATR